MNLPLLMLLCAALSAPAWAQSSCNSDGQSRPLALVERFISADCAECWGQAAASVPVKPDARTLVLDWIVPSPAGDEAPLSPAATPDAALRLQTLGLTMPVGTVVAQHLLRPEPGLKLRVAQGLSVADYIGARIEMRARPIAKGEAAPTVWLALVESITANQEGTPVARNIVRNLFQPSWDFNKSLSKSERFNYTELRPMRFAEGARPERLRLIAWVQDAQGKVLGAAQSVCLDAAR
ncbi:MAG: hypothetical protein IPO19_15365 [Rhodoferax sp.]|nr:hypothetical protein [Rhodoferax sp.]